jgi:hypothetical protein
MTEIFLPGLRERGGRRRVVPDRRRLIVFGDVEPSENISVH